MASLWPMFPFVLRLAEIEFFIHHMHPTNVTVNIRADMLQANHIDKAKVVAEQLQPPNKVCLSVWKVVP